jgi:8-amino-7-oxononanoate synthase
MQRDPAALKAALADLEQRNLRRRRRITPAAAVNFCSNDYLGLSAHPEVVQAFANAVMKYGVGSGASHLVSGHSHEHEALEEELAAFTGREKALVFSTGYMANMGAIGALADQKAAIVSDKLNHASLIDGCRLSGAKVTRYRHADSEHALEMLASIAPEVTSRLLVTDGVFSMDGDFAPLPELVSACDMARAWLVVDDAHGLGVVGPSGRGTCDHFGLTPEQVPVLIGTFGKASGTFGAFVAGSADLIEYLVQKARTYIYTTALPPAVAAATRAALEVSQRDTWRRERVLAHARRVHGVLGLPGKSVSPIIPVILKDEARALAASRELESRGFLVSAIRPPTVPPGTARLRVTLSATHEESQVNALIAALAEVREMGFSA